MKEKANPKSIYSFGLGQYEQIIFELNLFQLRTGGWHTNYVWNAHDEPPDAFHSLNLWSIRYEIECQFVETKAL